MYVHTHSNNTYTHTQVLSLCLNTAYLFANPGVACQHLPMPALIPEIQRLAGGRTVQQATDVTVCAGDIQYAYIYI